MNNKSNNNLIEKKEPNLLQLLEKYNSINKNKSNNNIFNKKNSIDSQNLKKTDLNNNNNNNKQLKNKKLEEMLKKLNNDKKFNDYNNFKSNISLNKSSILNINNNINHSFISNNSIKKQKKHTKSEYNSDLNNNNNNNNNNINNNNNNKINNSNNDNEGILALFKSQRKNNSNNNEKIFSNKNDIIFSEYFEQTFQNNELDNSFNSNKNDNQSKLMKTSSETKKIVETIDEKIKKLKYKFLYDTHIDIYKLSKYNKTLLTLYSFLETKDIYSIYHSIKLCNKNFKNYLIKNSKNFIVNKFKNIYQNLFLLENSNLIFKYDDKGNNFNIYLIIRAKIILNKQYKNYTIDIENISTYNNNKNNNKNIFRNIYRFDYKYKTSDYQKFWILREKTYFNFNDKQNNSYSMPILPFKYEDSFEININILSPMGLINFENFEWIKINYFENIHPNYIDYENYKIKKIKDTQLCDLDLSRFCEMELIKLKWISYEKLKNSNVINNIKNFAKNINKLLNIFKVEYDDVGFYIVKIYTEAKKEGKIENNIIGINLKINKEDYYCCNEIRKNGLIYENGKELQVRIGDCIVFYLTFNGDNVNEEKLY